MLGARRPSGGEMILSELMSVEFHSCCERARSGLGVPSPPHTSGGYLWNRGPIAVQVYLVKKPVNFGPHFLVNESETR